MEATPRAYAESRSFYDLPNVKVEQIPVDGGIPLGLESVHNSSLGIGGVYGSWGTSIDNAHMMEFVDSHLGRTLNPEERMNLGELGFQRRHFLPDLNDAEQLEVEVEVGARILRAGAQANGWDPSEVQGVVLGITSPVSNDYTEQIARRAGIPENALKVSVHKACDGSMGGLHLALNRRLGNQALNVAEELSGKKVLVGGIEGLSRMLADSKDKNALQLFGNGAGVFGVVPGESMKFIEGRTHEVYDDEGVLMVHMPYPHSGERVTGQSMVEIAQAGTNHYRFAGLMHVPNDGVPVDMAGPMGMVKLFVRTGVDVVKDVYSAYQQHVSQMDRPGNGIAIAIVHHANLKINTLMEKHLNREGIRVPMPWLLSEFGNVCSASNVIAFLRSVSTIKPGDHVLFDGFGAGTYYDAFVAEMGG